MTPADLEEMGFHVFPLLPGSKKPAVSGWTETPKEWAFHHNDNIGIYTGAFGDDKALLVVDVDNKGDKHGDDTLLALEIEGRELPETLETRTPSGGRHLFYVVDHPVKQGVEVLGPGVDIRSAGGYVVAPGSRLANAAEGDHPHRNEYAFAEPVRPLARAPQWLIDACGKPRERDAEAATPLPGVDPERARQRAIEYLRTAPEAVEGAGGDDTTFRVACGVKDQGVDADTCLELMQEHWFDGCGWSSSELAVKVRNAYEYGTSRPGVAAAEAVFEPVVTHARPDGGVPVSYRLESVSDVLDRPPPSWLVRGLVPTTGLAVLFGAPGSGKTFLVFDLGCAIVRGTPWAMRRTRRGNVVYVGLEGHIGSRLRAYMQHHGLRPDDLAGLKVVERQALNVLNEKDPVRLVQAIKAIELDPALVVIDTLNRSMPAGDENSSVDMGWVISSGTYIADRLGCATLFVHHSGKDETSGARGHSSLQGAVDAALSVTRTESGSRILEAVKVKDGEDGGQFAFDLETVDLGALRAFDPEAAGDERLTSCVVAGLHEVPPGKKATKVRLGTHAGNALTAFRNVLKFYEEDPQRAFADDSITLDHWVDAFLVLYEGDSAARTKFQQGRSDMLNKGLIEMLGNGRVRLTEKGVLA